MQARILCTHPQVAVIDDFATATECAALARWVDTLALPRADEVEEESTTIDDSDFGYRELAVAADPLAMELTARMEAAAGQADLLDAEDGGTLRLRRYHPGQGHPRHSDVVDFGSLRLKWTVMLVLEAPQAGGETMFPIAAPGPLRLVPRAGRVFMWQSTGPDGEPSECAHHLALAVRTGVLTTATRFIYAPVGAAPPQWAFPTAHAVLRDALQRDQALGHQRRDTVCQDLIEEF